MPRKPRAESDHTDEVADLSDTVACAVVVNVVDDLYRGLRVDEIGCTYFYG